MVKFTLRAAFRTRPTCSREIDISISMHTKITVVKSRAGLAAGSAIHALSKVRNQKQDEKEG